MSNLTLYIILYSSILILTSYIISRKDSAEDFLIAGRDRPSWQIMATKFSGSIGASWFITYTAFAYQYGLGTVSLSGGIIIGYLIFIIFAAKKIYTPSEKNKFYTIGDFVFYKTKSENAKKITNVLSIIIQFPWVLVSIIGGGKIISYFGLMSYEEAIIFTTIVIGVYLLIAGFKAVIITDIIQGIIIVALLLLIIFNITNSVSLTEVFSLNVQNVDAGTFIGFFLYGILSIYSFSHWYQLCYASKSLKQLKRGISYAIIPIILAVVIMLIIGLFVKLKSPDIDPDLAFIIALKTHLPNYFNTLGILLFFAGLMSSADTTIYAISSHLIKNFSGTKTINLIRILTIIILIISIVISIMFQNIVEVTILAAAISMILSIPMIYLIIGYNNLKVFYTLIINSIVGLIIGIIIFGITPSIMIPIILFQPIGLLILVILSKRKFPY